MLYTIKGNQLRVAFVEENGGEGAVVNDLYEGDVAFFPQGLIHYQQNLDCEPATFLAALNSEDPGVVTITTRFFELPSEAIQVSYVFSTSSFAHGNAVGSHRVYLDPQVSTEERGNTILRGVTSRPCIFDQKFRTRRKAERRPSLNYIDTAVK